MTTKEIHCKDGMSLFFMVVLKKMFMQAEISQ